MSLLDVSAALKEMAGANVSWEPRLCSRVRFHRSRCDICVRTCPEGAISWDQTLQLAEDKCTGCGICIAACPNGAFWDRRGGDVVLVNDICRLLSQTPSRVFRLVCSASDIPDEPFLHLRCLGRLTESIALAPLLSGASRVEIHRPDCRDCRCEPCLAHLDGTIRLSQGLSLMMGFDDDAIVECTANRRGEPWSRTPSAVTARRDFLRQAGQASVLAALALLPQLGEASEGQPLAQAGSPKRAFLLELLQSRAKQRPVSVKADGLRVAQIGVGSECTGCNVCSTLCPTGALERVESEADVSLRFRPWLCTGCLVCREACLFQAVSVSAEFPLESFRDKHSQLFRKLTRSTCPGCGEPFWDTGGNRCGRCQVNGRMAHPEWRKTLARGKEQA